ncbi:alpha-(1,3)-fucosyltransferase C-like [Daphnia carinata]|uniref:alpha-(1,3)-fucosyltransferase C-like n=1 Tax=Daphnia carinata TaxID=120202 RepID=UPI00257C6301|nr:alpha-(1,3)-fucosyltransferase C-like [Daphnia carinata]
MCHKSLIVISFQQQRAIPSTENNLSKIIFGKSVNWDIGPVSITTLNTTQEKPLLKVILMWNAWTKHMADEPLVKGQCPVKSCLFTTDMSLLQDSDVIVLHFDTLEDYPVNRQPHQRFVFYHFESPDNTASDLMNDPYFRYDYFNWTMTYRRDSDVFLRDYYGSLIAKNSLKNNTRQARYNYRNVTNNDLTNTTGYVNVIENIPGSELVKSQSDLAALIRGKNKMVTWFVGHCTTPVRREEYVRQLSQHVAVDIFGNCTRDCPYHCDDMLRAEYKFYLAFENSWCPDYVTEKFIRPFVYDAVPIFLGGADYSHFAPPHSYINARDFESPKALADYLMLLDKSDNLYAKYLDWKKDYYVSVPDFYGWCELCRMAHDTTLPRKVYHDIKQWWMQDAGNCESDSTKYF